MGRPLSGVPLLLYATLLTGSLVGGCGPSPAPGEAPPTVLLVTLDTTRADRLGAYGGPTGLTPRLDALARSGLVFEQARTTQPITLPAHTSILSGTYPSAHGVRDNGIFQVSEASLLLPEVLHARGFATGAALGSFVLSDRYGLDQGFDAYRMPPTRRLGQPLVGADRPADQVVDDALDWIRGVPVERPVFLWVHLFDAHFPYAPPEPFRSLHDHPYDGEVAFADQQVGRLLDGLGAAGRQGPRLVVVLADHGEGLGDHDEPVHGVFLYDTTMRVPLLVGGDGVPSGRVTTPVSVVDVAPTVLDWLGLEPDAMPDVRAPSLLATAAGAARASRPLPLESMLPWYEHGWHPQRGVVLEGYKYISSRRPELFDLASDPGELHDLSAQRPDVLAHLQRSLDALDAAHPPLGGATLKTVSDAERRTLASLGYLSASGARAGLPGSDAPDPKDRAGDLVRRDEALWLVWNGRRRMGVDGVLAEAPRSPSATDDSARWERGRDELRRARDLLSKLLEHNPGDPEFLSWLGVAELSLGEAAGARERFQRVVRHRPRSPEAHFNLAVACLELGADGQAYAEMLEALRLEPRAVRATRWMAEWHLARAEAGHAAWWLEQLAVEGELDPDDEDPEVRELASLTRRTRDEARRAGQAVEAPMAVRS